MKLTATKRENMSADAVRANNAIPAVFYGKVEPSTPIAINRKEFVKTYQEAGHSTILDLEVEGDSENKDILIREIQRDAVSEEILHVDLYVITRGEKMENVVPIEFVGESPAEKAGASIVMVMQEINIRALPRNLPSEITVNIEGLEEIGQSITIADLEMPEGVEAVAEETEVIVTASEVQEEVEEEVPTEIDMDAIGDSDQKGKGEEEGADDKGEEKKEEEGE